MIVYERKRFIVKFIIKSKPFFNGSAKQFAHLVYKINFNNASYLFMEFYNARY